MGSWSIVQDKKNIYFWDGRSTGIFLAPSPWAWIDPGVFALFGAAGFMGGTTRLTMSLAVIMLEVRQPGHPTHLELPLLQLLACGIVARRAFRGWMREASLCACVGCMRRDLRLILRSDHYDDIAWRMQGPTSLFAANMLLSRIQYRMMRDVGETMTDTSPSTTCPVQHKLQLKGNCLNINGFNPVSAEPFDVRSLIVPSPVTQLCLPQWKYTELSHLNCDHVHEANK